MDLLGQVLALVFPLYEEMLLSVPDILGINGVKVTLGHGEIIDGIQQVGLACTVIPNETIDPAAERQFELVVILEVDEGNTGQMHLERVSGQK
jgi:hypothetical protein